MSQRAHVVRQNEKKTILIGVHCPDSMVEALDRFISDQYVAMPRPEALRLILAEVLGKSNYLLPAGQVVREG